MNPAREDGSDGKDTRWADPYTREGVRPPGGYAAGVGDGYRVHEAGSFVLDENWNYRGVRSPFWRLYHNHTPGAVLQTGGRVCALTPDRVWLVPAGVMFDCEGVPGPRHLWIHFSTGLATARDWAEPRAVTLTPPLRALLGWLRRSLAERVPEPWTVGELGQATLHAVFAAAGFAPAQPEEPRLRAVLLAIEQRLAQPPGIGELARVAHLSESRFARWFREVKGETPAAYMRRRRVAEACRRLAFTEDSVDQVAEALGFANRFHFGRVFKAVLGETPGAFKRRRGPR